jgi:hypothetical protein
VTSSGTIPGNTDNSEFYDAAPLEPHLLYQGEILIDVPIVNMPKPIHWLLLRTKSGRMVDEALQGGNVGGLVKVLDSNQSKELWYGATDGDFVMARLSKLPALVLSQTCDVQTKEFIQVAPIFPAIGSDDHLARLRRGLILSSFWLKESTPRLPESYADLELIQAVHKSYLKRISSKQHFRLTHSRTRELQRFVTRYFGRPNSFDAGADRAPVTGTYLCVACFYMNAIVTSTVLAGGQDFALCAVCGGRAWVPKGR